MNKLLLIPGAVLLFGMSASANIVVNGGFDSAISLWETKVVDPDGMQAPNAGVNGVDAGWIASGSSANSEWETAGAAGSRTSYKPDSSFGIAQIISNPGDSTFDNGDEIRVSFDYALAGTRNIGFNYRLFGIEGTGAWAGSNGIALNKPLDADVPGVAGAHTYVQLDNLAPILGAASATYSADVTLANQYDYFAIVFWTDMDNGGPITIDNVNVSAIPEPATLGMVAFVAGGLLFIRRKFLV